jgi:hypothetical protein
MTEIHELMESGHDLVKEHERFPQEYGSTPPIDELKAHVRTRDADEVDLDFDRLDSAISAAKEEFDLGRREQRTSMDSNLAPIVHQCLDIPIRIAALPGFWQYQTLFRYPELITSRWSRENDTEEKFLGSQKDLYSNHLARLWWGAELTKDADGNYYATHRLFNKQRLVNYVLDSSFRRYRPAARAFATELTNETGGDITDIAKRFNKSLSTIQLESRDEHELRDQLAKIRDHVG